MKVIKRDEWKNRIKCKYCGSTLLMTEKDIKRGEVTGYSDLDVWFYVICGACKKNLRVPNEALSPSLEPV